MRRKYSVKEIIVAFLHFQMQGKRSFLLKNSSIQLIIPKYAADAFNEYHSPDTFSRKWRELREEKLLLDKQKIEVEELTNREIVKYNLSGIEKVFRIKRVLEPQIALFDKAETT